MPHSSAQGPARTTNIGLMLRVMSGDDYTWAAALMQRRRERFAQFSPVFWRPATGVEEAHAEFMRALAAQDGTVAVRTDHGFAISTPAGDRCVVDDFAVDHDDLWRTDGAQLAFGVWAARSFRQTTLRVVTATADEPKRTMLRSLGLTVVERWWVKELNSAGAEVIWGHVMLGSVSGLIVPAPPVYDPQGPVCLLNGIAAADAAVAADQAARRGAVLAIVPDTSDRSVVAPIFESAGFHNPSEFYEGEPR